MKRALAALASAGFAIAAHAGDAAQPDVSARFSSAVERLSNGTPDWRENSASVQLGFAPHQVLDLTAGDISRFGLHDNHFGASYTQPLGSALAASVDASASTTHHVLARHTLGAELQYEFAPAWLVHGGARSSSFDSATVNGGLLALEHYFGQYSVTLGWKPTRAFGATASGAEARASWYYGERNAVTLIAAGGREAASIRGGVALTDVRALALTGRHWLDRRWALAWALDHTRQGNLYNRNGLSLGAQYAF
jgi:YaiO family outer membrane protein